jgi:hypothetical protein
LEGVAPHVNGAVRDQATEAQKAVSEELLAAWQLHVSRVEQQLHSGWEEHIRTIVSERFSELSHRLQEESERRVALELAGMKRTEVEAAARRVSESLSACVRRLQAAGTRAQWIETTVEAASNFAQRAALLTLRESDGPISSGVMDLEMDSGNALRSEPVPLRYAPALLHAVESGQSVVAVRSGAEISVALENMLGPGGPRAHLYPLLAHKRCFALLYAEGVSDGNAMELVAAAAGMSAAGNRDILRQATYEPAPAPQASPRPAVWNHLPADEQEVHLRAQRFARTQAAQMRLYRSEEVRAGRASADLYGMLREHIDQARQAYHDQFVVGCQSMVDYLHFELVKTLANNDERLLGGAYPGPLD